MHVFRCKTHQLHMPIQNQNNFEQSSYYCQYSNSQSKRLLEISYATFRLQTQAKLYDIQDSDSNKIEFDVFKATTFNLISFSLVFLFMKTNLIFHLFLLAILLLPYACDINTSSSIIHNKLRLLNDCKSSGPGGWPPVALTETAVEIFHSQLAILQSHLNLVFHFIVGKQLTNVVSIHKSDSGHLPNNYQPISL